MENKRQKASARRTRPPLVPAAVKLTHTPASALDLLTLAFISAIEVRDPRYDLSLLIPFCRKLVPRLGYNDALDSSISAITVAYSDVRNNDLSQDALVSYGKALKALRLCLDDPATATTAETLTAIYMLIIFQVCELPGPR